MFTLCNSHARLTGIHRAQRPRLSEIGTDAALMPLSRTRNKAITATKYLPTPATLNRVTSVPQLHLARRILAALRSVSFAHHSLAVDLHLHHGQR